MTYPTQAPFRSSVNLLYLIITFLLLVSLTIVADICLHAYNFDWVGRYLGILGSTLIILSFIYSLRKRKILKSGKLPGYLRLHEYMCWTGSLLVLIHAGIHFNALLPWLTTFTLLVNVFSGLVGKFLLKKSVESLRMQREELTARGISEREVSRQIFWDALAVAIMKKWRTIHIPIALALLLTAISHIVTTIMYW